MATALVAGAAGTGEARAADGPTALGIDLPPVEVKLPGVEVKLPAVEVDLASVDVKVPSVEVKLPPADVKPPAVEVALPAPEVKAPQVDAPASSAPPASAAAPRSPTGSQATPASTPATGRPATPRETAQAASGAAPARGGDATRGGSAARRDATSPTRSRPADPGSDAAVPPAIRRRERRLRQVVRGLSGCLGALRTIETRVLTLRAGGAARAPLTRRQVARRLDVGLHRVVAAERRGLDRLRERAHAGGCAGQPAPEVAAPPAHVGTRAAPPAAPTPAASPPPRGTSRDRSGVVEAVERSLGGGIAPQLAPSVLLIRASNPPLLVLLIGGFLVGFAIVWARERAGRPRPVILRIDG